MSTEKDTTSAAPKKAAPKKGNASSELVIGTAANAMKKAHDELKKAVDIVGGLGEKAENFQALIAQKEDRIKEIDVEYAEKKRAASVNLDLEIKADEDAAVKRILAENNQAAVDNAELAELRSRANRSDEAMRSEINKAVGAATSSMKKDHENAIALKDAQFAADKAQDKATIESLNKQVVYLEQQCRSWENALNQERAAGIERAKASAVGTINVAGPAKN